MADFPIELPGGTETWERRVALYEKSDCPTEEMLNEAGPRTGVDLASPGHSIDSSI